MAVLPKDGKFIGYGYNPETLKPYSTGSKPVETSDGGSSSYYELPPNCSQLIDVIREQEMSYSQGNIFKAAYRWDKKPDLEYNLRKIIYFAQYELDRLYAEMDPKNANK